MQCHASKAYQICFIYGMAQHFNPGIYDKFIQNLLWK